MAPPARDRMGARGRESGLRERIRIESVEVLSHQLMVDRRKRGKVAAVDVGIAALLCGAAFGTVAVAGYFGRGRR